MDIGTIKSIEKDGDAIICTIDFGADDVTTATLYGLSSQNDYPMIDDSAAVIRGDDDVIVSIFRPCPSDLVTGESIVYGRDSSGAIASSVRMGTDGVVKINDGKSGLVTCGEASDFVAMAKKVDGLFDKFYNVFSTWTPTPTDGGTALKTIFTGIFTSAPSTVASDNLKAD